MRLFHTTNTNSFSDYDNKNDSVRRFRNSFYNRFCLSYFEEFIVRKVQALSLCCEIRRTGNGDVVKSE
jgi:hypothetical protein